tara:strand:- start:65 stop:433 length:369 start_codon:yes stop_codon:yes gene_type:complete
MIKKSILAVGSIGIDWLELPNKISGKTIGGSLTYFTRTAGLNSKVNIVGIIGDDYPTEGKKLFDELVIIKDDCIVLTKIGEDFTQNIMNIFDKYDPPNKSYKERLSTVKKAKEAQAQILERL